MVWREDEVVFNNTSAHGARLVMDQKKCANKFEAEGKSFKTRNFFNFRFLEGLCWNQHRVLRGDKWTKAWQLNHDAGPMFQKKKNRCTQKLEMELGRIVPVLLPAASTGRYASKWLRNDCCQPETKLKWIQNTRQLKARSSDWALATTLESSDSMLAVLLQILCSDTFPPERFPILRVTYCTCIIFH